jgi:hypothetical protein
LSVIIGNGAIRLTPSDEVRPFAYETLTKSSWTGRVALCLPEDRCAVSGRTLLTEIGPDRDAIRREDLGATLFDLGIGAKHAEFWRRARTASSSVSTAVSRCSSPSRRPAIENGRGRFARNEIRVTLRQLEAARG